MNKDEAIEIERVVNGFIVRPRYNQAYGAIASIQAVYVFETFGSMVNWLHTHFTKPELTVTKLEDGN